MAPRHQRPELMRTGPSAPFGPNRLMSTEPPFTLKANQFCGSFKQLVVPVGSDRVPNDTLDEDDAAWSLGAWNRVRARSSRDARWSLERCIR